MYSTSILPTLHKRRRHKKSSRQRVARNLDHFDHHPDVWLHDWYPGAPPPILRLPAELRQSIIFVCIEDRDLYTPRPNMETRTLSLICKTLARDVQATKTMWDVREQQLRMLYGVEKAAFNNYISELMGPIGIASAILSRRMTLGNVQHRKRASNRANERRLAEKKLSGVKQDYRIESEAHSERFQQPRAAKAFQERNQSARKRPRMSEQASITVDEICASLRPGYVSEEKAEILRQEQKRAVVLKLKDKKAKQKRMALERKNLRKALYRAELEKTGSREAAKAAKSSLPRLKGRTSALKAQAALVRRIETFERENEQWIKENPNLARIKMNSLKRIQYASDLEEALGDRLRPGRGVEIDFAMLPELKNAYGHGRLLRGIYTLFEVDDVSCVVNEAMREIVVWRNRRFD